MHLDGAINFLKKADEGPQLRPLDGALDLKFCIQRAIHPVQRSQLFTTKSNCTTDQSHALHFRVMPRRERSVNVVLEASNVDSVKSISHIS